MTSAPPCINITPLPLTKILLHAIQNPHAPVSGILIGKFLTSSDDAILSVRDVLPVCHCHPTKPLLDTAFRLAEAALSLSDDDVSVVGWYTSNERAADNTASAASYRITHSIAARYPDREPVLVLLDNILLGSYLIGDNNDDGNTCPLMAYGKDGRSQLWTREVNVVLEEGGRPSGQQLLECDDEVAGAGITTTVWDFESHLGSVGTKELDERDWIENHAVASFVQRCA
mmetsp:Transcript_29111/g.35465  ORF Transcript_29111/g.35465 Transcript_29111/m.35465 type:complete len:229 (-) Transcript_29111:21-707(-)|eukprot:CAMPEP_0172497656 /NCGR_PEP_ID=MMETSP1066-20121228/102942_1 /TAXON_ID=671091 /ORGANISM="Coscinodiscus wailesii, Strain CCMP2513" /LENGTH=228 /DNA_ID=CAMNT_0013270543 /DNA_START=121 /DNA_END=807 /DNA_ORIENTATION=-